MKISEVIENLPVQDTNKPWRDENGKIRKDDELREMATQWTPSTWEAFLADNEMGENVENSPEDEVLFPHPSREDIFSTENSLKDFISNLKIQYFPKLQEVIARMRTVLSKQQHEIVILHFWDGLNQSQVAEKLEISQQQVFIQLERSLTKLRVEMLKKLNPTVASEPQADSTPACLLSEKKNAVNSTS